MIMATTWAIASMLKGRTRQPMDESSAEVWDSLVIEEEREGRGFEPTGLCIAWNVV